MLTACSNTQITGQYVDDNALAELQEGIKNKQGVLQILGSATFIPDNEPNVWYYVSRNLKINPLSKPKLHQQRVIKLTFDSLDNLIDIELKTDLNNRSITLENSSTYSKGKQESSMQHFIKNFGRFNIKREKKR